MHGRIRDKRQSIIRQKLRGLTQRRSLILQVRLEQTHRFLKFLFILQQKYSFTLLHLNLHNTIETHGSCTLPWLAHYTEHKIIKFLFNAFVFLLLCVYIYIYKVIGAIYVTYCTINIINVTVM